MGEGVLGRRGARKGKDEQGNENTDRLSGDKFRRWELMVIVRE